MRVKRLRQLAGFVFGTLIAGSFASCTTGPVSDPGNLIANTLGMRLAYIPAGRFDMGSPPEEKGRQPDEFQHAVLLTRPFRISATEVTQAQWLAVMGANRSHFKGDDLPVEKVSWRDAVAFCERLSELEGRTYRLPTEAEWEYACRATTTTRFSMSPTSSVQQPGMQLTVMSTHIQLAASAPTPGVSTTCTAMYRSGAVTTMSLNTPRSQ